MCRVPPYFELLTRCPKSKCAVSPPLIPKHLISSVVSVAQLVSPSVALPAELVYLYNNCQQIPPVSYKIHFLVSFFSPTKGGGWVTFMENFIFLSLPQTFVFYSEFRFLEPFPIHISFVNSDPGKLLKTFAGG